MKNNKGISLVALVITIIVMLILASTATYVGWNAITTSKEQRFLAQMKEISEAVSLHKSDYQSLGLTPLETEYTYTENEISHTYNYKLQTLGEFEKIGVSNFEIEDTIYVNFAAEEIYALNGFNGKHTLKDFGVEYYEPLYVPNEEGTEITFTISLEPQEYTWKYIINDSSIIDQNGNGVKGNLFYSEYYENNNFAWKRVNRNSLDNGYELEIKEPGIYKLQFRGENNLSSEIKTIYAYVKDGLQLYYDGEYNQNYNYNSNAELWGDLSGNNNNGTLTSCIWENDNSLSLDGTSSKLECNSFQDYTIATVQKVTLENGQANITYGNSVTAITTQNLNFDIGKYCNGADSSFYKGKIYNFRVYDRELSEEELNKNYKIDKIRYNLSE